MKKSTKKLLWAGAIIGVIIWWQRRSVAKAMSVAAPPPGPQATGIEDVEGDEYGWSDLEEGTSLPGRGPNWGWSD